MQHNWNVNIVMKCLEVFLRWRLDMSQNRWILWYRKSLCVLLKCNLALTFLNVPKCWADAWLPLWSLLFPSLGEPDSSEKVFDLGGERSSTALHACKQGTVPTGTPSVSPQLLPAWQYRPYTCSLSARGHTVAWEMYWRPSSSQSDGWFFIQLLKEWLGRRQLCFTWDAVIPLWERSVVN